MISTINRIVIFLTFWMLSAFSVHAQSQFITGTGFFVAAQGDIVTNAHVISGCDPARIRLKRNNQLAPARLIGMDAQHDLALLRAEVSAPDTAYLAAVEGRISAGDPVMVIGFPKEKSVLRDYKVAFAKVLDVKGLQGEPQWYQFSDSAQKGNSGGPLLDEAGNVIGVVTGKAQLFSVDGRTREQTLVASSDIAVALPVLKRFLMAHQVRYRQSDSRVRRDENYVEKRAAQFIAQIICRASNNAR